MPKTLKVSGGEGWGPLRGLGRHTGHGWGGPGVSGWQWRGSPVRDGNHLPVCACGSAGVGTSFRGRPHRLGAVLRTPDLAGGGGEEDLEGCVVQCTGFFFLSAVVKRVTEKLPFGWCLLLWWLGSHCCVDFTAVHLQSNSHLPKLQILIREWEPPAPDPPSPPRTSCLTSFSLRGKEAAAATVFRLRQGPGLLGVPG